MSDALEAVCEAAGWPYCSDHDRPRYDGSNPCARLHDAPEVKHDQACSWPDDDCICGAFESGVECSEDPKEEREMTRVVGEDRETQ